MDVKCINASPFDATKPNKPDLIEGNSYMVLGIEGEYYRIFGAVGFPYLYHISRFEIVNSEEEPDWTVKTGVDGIKKTYPEQLHAEGLFESYFTFDMAARYLVNGYANRIKSRRMDEFFDGELIMKARGGVPFFPDIPDDEIDLI